MIRLGGDKMSKSKGNLVAPEELLDTVGADALRLAHLFVGPPQDDVDWEGVGIEGCSRFLSRLWRLGLGEAGLTVPDRAMTESDLEIRRATHRLIARVTDDYERWSYNTAVAAFMEFTNDLYRAGQRPEGIAVEVMDEAIDTMLLMLAPMAPHITAELWQRRNGGHVHEQRWPEPIAELVAVATVTMVVQVNGKVRDRVEVDAGVDSAEAERIALGREKIIALLDDSAPRKVIVRPPQLVNIVL